MPANRRPLIVLVGGTIFTGYVQPRYTITFQVFLLAAAAACLGTVRWDSRWLVAIATVAVAFLPAMPLGVGRSAVSDWHQAVTAAEVGCHGSALWGAVAVGPDIPRPWGYMVVPCAVLRRS